MVVDGLKFVLWLGCVSWDCCEADSKFVVCILVGGVGGCYMAVGLNHGC